MKYLKTFNESVSGFETDVSKVEQILFDCAKFLFYSNGFPNYVDIRTHPKRTEKVTINPDGTVDIRGNISIITRDGMDRLGIKFRNVSGVFELGGSHSSGNIGASIVITGRKARPRMTLEGCPDYVGGNFLFDGNVGNLVGAPKGVGGDFKIKSDHITSLEGCPERVDGLFSIRGGSLTTLDGIPQNFSPENILIATNEKKLLDPRALKDCTTGRFLTPQWRLWEPFFELVDAFTLQSPPETYLDKGVGYLYGNTTVNIQKAATKRFLDSLHYNYLRGEPGKPYINLFRFKEALSEHEINFHGILRHYEYRDEEGRVVDFDGNPI